MWFVRSLCDMCLWSKLNYGLLIEFSRSLFCCCPQSVVFGGGNGIVKRREERSRVEGRGGDGGGWWWVCVGKVLLKVAVIYFH